MNRKELAEIKRRLDREKGCISCIRGCYVSAKGEVISVFRRPLGEIPEGECAAFFSLFKKVLSGVPGKNRDRRRFFLGRNAQRGRARPADGTARRPGGR